MKNLILIRDLPAFVVHVVVFPVNQLGNGDKFIAFILKSGKNGIQGVFGVFGAVVAENDTAVAEILAFCNPFDNVVSTVIFPVQGVNIPLDGRCV